MVVQSLDLFMEFSHAMTTCRCVRVHAHVCVREFDCKLLLFIVIGRYELEIRRQYYCTAFCHGGDTMGEPSYARGFYQKMMVRSLMFMRDFISARTASMVSPIKPSMRLANRHWYAKRFSYVHGFDISVVLDSSSN